VHVIGRFAAVVLSLVATPAWGACTGDYDAASLGDDLGEIASGLRGMETERITGAGTRLADGLPCVKAPMAPVVLSRAYRFVGLYHYLKGDEGSARRWFRSSLELDSTYEWGVNELAIDDPLRSVFEQERGAADVEPTPVGGRALAIPAGSRISMDGRTISEAKATLSRPHLIQVITDASNSVVSVHLIDGNQFPESLLTTASEAPVVEDKPKINNDYAVQTVERSRPPLKTPMLIGGALGLAGGLGLYTASFITHKKFEEATTTGEVAQYRTLTNTLVLGAAGSFALGAGMGYFGVIINAGPGVGWVGQF